MKLLRLISRSYCLEQQVSSARADPKQWIIRKAFDSIDSEFRKDQFLSSLLSSDWIRVYYELIHDIRSETRRSMFDNRADVLHSQKITFIIVRWNIATLRSMTNYNIALTVLSF